MPNYIPLDLFSWDPKTRKLTAEISDLTHRFSGDVIADFKVRSHHTGRVEQFQFSHQIHNSENELMYIELKPVNPDCNVRSVILFND